MALGGADNLARSPELRTKLLWTLGLLCAYRIGVHIPVPGVDGGALAHFFESVAGTLFGLFDMFSGGGLRNVSVFALGIMPYISASIILQLLQVVSPELKRMAKEEGAAGRRKITQYTRYSTVLITIIQGFGIAVGLETMYSPGGVPVVLEPGWTFRIMTMLTLTAGTVLIMWLGEQITEKGIGNGISLIIFSGIVVGIPGALVKSFQLIKLGDMSLFIALALVILMVAVLIGVVFMERAQRRIPIQYAKRQVGRKMYGGQSTHLPLRVNTAGVIPPIFASSLLLFPATMANFDIADWLKTAASWFTPSSILYNVIFIALIFFFCFFYTAIIFDPKDVAENLKKAGGFIPGIRPGEKTQEYLDAVLSRLTLWGGVYISVISVLPMLLIAEFNVPFYFGGTSILILVGVAMDFMSQIESHLISRQYMERAQRRIPIQYAKRQVGRKMYGGQSTHLPLRVNTAGVIPPIFASSLLLFPATMANFDIADWLKTAASWFTPSSILYNVIFIALIFFFCFFYTAIIFDPKDVAENLKKAGGFIPGIRPGEKTQEYLDAVLSRLTLWGGVYISVISVLPMLLIAEFNVPFYFGGTSILILVGVAMDFMSQIESHLISRQYEGLMGKTRIKGRS